MRTHPVSSDPAVIARHLLGVEDTLLEAMIVVCIERSLPMTEAELTKMSSSRGVDMTAVPQIAELNRRGILRGVVPTYMLDGAPGVVARVHPADRRRNG